MRNLTGLAVALLLVACNSQPPVSSALTGCPEVRPQVCTMEYAPVCARLAGDERRQYSSACNACADDAVIDYLAGPCPE